MKAVKENKVYTIDKEADKERYLKEGYDIYDDEGTILEYSPLKKITYGEYVKVADENKKLQLENAKLAEQLAEIKGKKTEKGSKKE